MGFKERVICWRWNVLHITFEASYSFVASYVYCMCCRFTFQSHMMTRLGIIMFYSCYHSSYIVKMSYIILCIYFYCIRSMIGLHLHHTFVSSILNIVYILRIGKKQITVVAMMGYGNDNYPSVEYHRFLCFIVCWAISRFLLKLWTPD